MKTCSKCKQDWYKEPENREKRAEYDTRRRQEKPELYREYARNRRAWEKANTPNQMPPDFWQILLTMYGGACMNPNCNGIVKELTLDHVVPLSKGGSHSLDKVVQLKQECTYG